MDSATLAALQTESRNGKTTNIDTVSTLEFCQIMNDEDAQIASAVKACLPQIAEAIDVIVPRIVKGGRVVYIGAGTSLGPPTFSVDPTQFVGLIAGGERALRSAIEGAEDSESKGGEALAALSPPFCSDDVLIGIASSGRTPYVLGSLKHAQALGAATVGLACVNPSAMRGLCGVLIECVTGPEVVTGSTRLKAGTATKMILNMISTGAQVRSGKTFGNLMVDLSIRNEKLQLRARRVFRELVASSISVDATKDEELDALISSCDGSVKLAILVAILGCGVDEARGKLERHSGVLRQVLQAEGLA
ncbi:related to N-acetylmuramic acid 6-phosphate etherase [Cephalotrichum gorgonifer]|uniref:Related to N-acetylmuramic acid 6-phosphate etherase n=1 Tax=Cephalotrichum gorgonifer TaxID=2041049 RepID=A0AAE8SWF1_9PEZI|nr:related to N-acetylmuramic acid 6-phosphate etherase [Cephalotrichum gorgonifer]